MTRDDVMQSFQDTGALLEGHFELRSGLHSPQFFQCAKVLQWPRLAETLCLAAVEQMRAALPDLKVDTVVSPAMGGITIGHEIGRALDSRFIFVEKENNRLVMRRGFTVEKGERFVVGEDVVTRGGRVQETIDIVRARGGIVEAVVVLVDRSGGKASFDAPLFSLLRMEPVTYEPGACPLCAQGLELVHPGS